ncbi:MAG: SUMF1/EgtB/PvdO family nonheme iron enzyme [Alphaproteobacteria bacterium]
MTANDQSLSTHSPPDRRAAIEAAFAHCRAGTYALFADFGEEEFRRQPHPDFSPAGWHLGHVAYTEAVWLICRCAGEALPAPQWKQTFDVNGLPKAERGGKLPAKAAVIDYAEEIRERTLDYLANAPLADEERVWRFVLQHEAQHGETITFLRNLMGDTPAAGSLDTASSPDIEFLDVPGGPGSIGSDGFDAIDNERPRHDIDVPGFSISRYPVTQGQFARFIEAGGYGERGLWSREGWRWLERAGIARPLYWREGCLSHPVAGVSAHEAEAFCRFADARLPSEAEWEKAASWDPENRSASAFPWGDTLPGPGLANCDRARRGTTPVDRHPTGRSPYGAEDMMGNVWEWTSSVFAPYRGFEAWPYEGYSKIYFDGKHRALRGGSWASRPWAMRASFRNWYVPETRQILSGFRLARDSLRN